METRVRELLEKHKEDKDLTGEADKIEAGLDWSEADLRGFNLSGLKLSSLLKRANFQNAALSEANLRGATLSGANFQGSRLMEAKMQKAILIKANFRKSNLDYASLIEANLMEANFERTILIKASLQRAELMDANLKGAILIGANFRNASLVGCDLSGASLVRANLREADFDEKVNLQNVNLYQATLDGSTLKNSYHALDRIIIQERNKKHAIARDVYMNLKNYFNKEGMYEVAAEYYYREKMMETKCICSKEHLGRWIFNHVMNITSGFGERPIRVLAWWIIVIVGFALFYFNGKGLMVGGDNISHTETFLDYLYFSIVTFTTLGFGDIAPKPDFRIFASIEAIIGAILTAMFIYVFSRKMGR